MAVSLATGTETVVVVCVCVQYVLGGRGVGRTVSKLDICIPFPF